MSITHLWPLMEIPQSVFSSLRAGGLCMAGTGQHGNTLLLPQPHSLTAKSGDQWPWASEDPNDEHSTLWLNELIASCFWDTGYANEKTTRCLQFIQKAAIKIRKNPTFIFLFFKNYKYNAFVWPAEAKPPPVIETWTLTWMLSEREAIYCASDTRGSPKNFTKKAKPWWYVAEREHRKR